MAEAEELEQEIGDTPLTDRATEVAAMMLLRLLQEADAEKGPNRRGAVLEIVREMQRLRRGDHEMTRSRIQEERWEAEQRAAHEAEMKEMTEKLEWQKTKTRVMASMLCQEYREGMANGTLAPERAAELREYFQTNAEWLREYGVSGIPKETPNPIESIPH